MKENLLILDDDLSFAAHAATIAREAGFEVHPALTLGEALSAAEHRSFDCALIDIGLPDGCGLDLLSSKKLAGASKIVMSGDSALAAWAGREIPGMLGFLTKPFRFAAFRDLLDLRRASPAAATQVSGRSVHMLGESPVMRQVIHEIRAVAPTRFPVMLHGASGTGKELAARMIHEESGRTGELITVNCAAISPDLLASQMFGHRRGSFTGAIESHAGLIAQAEGGTLFLDEITEAPPAVQAALLRFLESGEVTTLGSRGPRQLDVRVVAATNSEPLSAVAMGRLRADLYFRVAGFEIRMPDLREREGDVEIIARGMLTALNKEYGTARWFASDAFDLVRGHPWEGNVRELRQAVQRAWLGSGDSLVLRPASRLQAESVPETLEAIERRAILEALLTCGNDRTAAARRLGISTKTIYNKLARYRLMPSPSS
ncbi:DNA-binding NtrC family response regulator [Luteibacter sp. HA06]